MNNKIIMSVAKQLSSSFRTYDASFIQVEDTAFFLANINGKDTLVIHGDDGVLNSFQGERINRIKCCAMTHTNRLSLGRYASYTKPSSYQGNGVSFGFGDRLGMANGAHLSAIENTTVFPVLAQQSMRELILTKRTYDDVLDAAAWSVFKTGWRNGYGADGDHLKTKSDIEFAIQAGYTMLTIDCSDSLVEAPKCLETLQEQYEQIPRSLRQDYEKRYISKNVLPSVRFDQTSLMQAAVTYHKAVAFIIDIDKTLVKPVGRRINLEISIDETNEETAPTAHYFVANELLRNGVNISSLAPRFFGQFQKGIDYIGKRDFISESLRIHKEIADYFGYRISVHSGSDKFSIFPVIGKITKGVFHIKTSGTSWLEAVRVIAQIEPKLFRKMFACAEAHFTEASKYYVVHCNLEKIMPISQVLDEDLVKYLEQDDSRQLMHITYGFQFADQKLKQEIFNTLRQHSKDYDIAVKQHMEKHLKLLKCL